jgi:hypothetical protein
MVGVTLSSAAMAQEPDWVTIPAGTEVTIEAAETIGSKTAHKGQSFAIRLAEPIIIDGRAVVPAGIPGGAEVVHAAKARGAGRPGELILAARYLDWNGTRIPLRSFHASQTGQDRTKDVDIVSILFIGAGGFFIKGGNIEVPAGTRAISKLAEETRVPLLEPEPPATPPTKPEG